MLVSIVSVLFIGSDSLLLFPVLFINFRTIDLFPAIHEHSDPLKHSRKRIQRSAEWPHSGILIYDIQICMGVVNVAECLNVQWRLWSMTFVWMM
jgi:hypothetical protein